MKRALLIGPNYMGLYEDIKKALEEYGFFVEYFQQEYISSNPYVLTGKKQGRIKDLCVDVASQMVSMATNEEYESCKKKVIEVIDNGKAYQKFLEFVKAQGGDITSLKVSDKTIEIRSNKEGTLKTIYALPLGELSVSLGAGRRSKEDAIDHTVGIVINKEVGDIIKKNDLLATLYVNNTNLNLNQEEYFEIV